MPIEFRLITFVCNECNSIIKTLIRQNGFLDFSVNNKVFSSKNVLTESGYYRCVECDKETNVRFEYLYS